MLVQPYVFFDGRCEEALEFYRGALDAEVMMLLRYNECPDPPPPGTIPPGSEHKVMHARFRVGESTVLASDGHCGGTPVLQGFSLSITLPSVEECERRFAALAEGGQVRMPLGKTFFSPRFGMLVDRFGVPWMLYVAP